MSKHCTFGPLRLFEAIFGEQIEKDPSAYDATGFLKTVEDILVCSRRTVAQGSLKYNYDLFGVLEGRFVMGLSLEQTGRRLGNELNRERVRQVQEKALRILRHPNNIRRISRSIPGVWRGLDFGKTW